MTINNVFHARQHPSVAPLIGLIVTLVAMRSRSYRVLSQSYQAPAPEAELLKAAD